MDPTTIAPVITAPQIRAARALLGWSQSDLAETAAISRTKVIAIEKGSAVPTPEIMSRLRIALSQAGVEFAANHGVRLRPSGLDVYEGPNRFEDFYNFLYDQLKRFGGDVCLSVTDERLLAKYRKNATVHYNRMQELYERGIFKSFRILANKSNFASDWSYNTYKWQPRSSIAPTAFYTFADCLALISFVHETPPYVVVIQSAPIADAYRQAFDTAWIVAKSPPKLKGHAQ